MPDLVSSQVFSLLPTFLYWYRHLQDGDDNTVTSSYWSCQPSNRTGYIWSGSSSAYSYTDEVDEYCEVGLGFNNEYTVSHIMLCELVI